METVKDLKKLARWLKNDNLYRFTYTKRWFSMIFQLANFLNNHDGSFLLEVLKRPRSTGSTGADLHADLDWRSLGFSLRRLVNNSSGPIFFSQKSHVYVGTIIIYHYIIQFYPIFGIIMNVHQSKLGIFGDQLILTKANSDCLLNRLIWKNV